jgi:protein transport protein SEC24
VLPNINPDAAFGMQVAIEDSLAQYKSVTFQVALLYTSSKGKQNRILYEKIVLVILGERRIRVHTLSLPVSANLMDIYSNVDQEATISLIAKMGK